MVNKMIFQYLLEISSDRIPFTFLESLFHRMGAATEKYWALVDVRLVTLSREQARL